MQRLGWLLNDPQRPVQILFAGKAHPRDNQGKEMIRRILQVSREEGFRHRLVFLEDYDLSLAHYLVSGVDVWLNTPRRPLEASGTSGMKIAVNGGLNISVLDGWWCEAHTAQNGWAIGRGEEYDDEEAQDVVESQALYDILEKEVVPTFYDRGADGLPRKWTQRMKASMRSVSPVFNSHRMVQEYTDRFYVPAIARGRKLLADGLADARALAAWRDRLRKAWSAIQVVSVEVDEQHEYAVGAELPVRAAVKLGKITPDDVAVQIYEGKLDPRHQIQKPTIIEMTCESSDDTGVHHYVGSIPCRDAGLHGCVLRILPRHEDITSPHDTGLILWV